MIENRTWWRKAITVAAMPVSIMAMAMLAIAVLVVLMCVGLIFLVGPEKWLYQVIDTIEGRRII